jgi:hypothetical protein
MRNADLDDLKDQQYAEGVKQEREEFDELITVQDLIKNVRSSSDTTAAIHIAVFVQQAIWLHEKPARDARKKREELYEFCGNDAT